MQIRQVVANKSVKDDLGKVAIERGPIVYCLEAIDNENIDNIGISPNDLFSAGFNPNLLGGIETISGKLIDGKVSFSAIPYYSWNNRGIGKMKVWIPKK